MFTQLHEIVYYGGGGYDWYTVYNMPIWLRKFTYQQISECKKRESKANSKTPSKPGNTQIDLANPNKSALPDYAKNTSPTSVDTKPSKK